MLETSESVTAAAWDAARALVEAPDQAAFAAAVAGTVCFDGAVDVAKACIQVLGGVGFTFEHDAHLYLRRALALRASVGSTHDAAARLESLAGSDGVRRHLHIDLDSADDDQRDEVRARARRIADLPADEQRAELAGSGYLTPHWPTPYGLGADPVHQLVIDEELAAAGVTGPTCASVVGPLRRSSGTAPTSSVSGSWVPPCAARSSGASCSASPVPDRTSRRCGRRPSGFDKLNRRDWLGGCSPGRRCGPRSPTGPTGGSAWPAPTPTRPSTPGITYFLVDMTSDGHRRPAAARAHRRCRCSTRCSSTTCSSRTTAWSAR